MVDPLRPAGLLSDRKRAAALGRETLDLVSRGGYVSPSGVQVSLGSLVAASVAGTVHYPPGAPLPPRPAPSFSPRLEVTGESTLAAARRLPPESRPLALNFASAKSPGGGFLSGSLAQEGSLARSSALHATLAGGPMYELHRARRDPFYTDSMIYSPCVPVFRDDAGALLEAPYLCSFLTAPAVNARALLGDPARSAEIPRVMGERLRRVLAVAAAHGHESLVLGAWGCGAFGNAPATIAALFAEALRGEFAGAFGRVVFAVLDWSPEQRFRGPFERALRAAPDEEVRRASPLV